MYLSNGTLLKGGEYKIVRHISSGGFGNTYEALDVNLDKRVAIKEFFVKDFCSRASDTTLVTIINASKKPLIEHLRKKFWEEARAIAKMEHENIVKVQALFEENDTAYYVMDFIDGESVHNLLKRRGSLPEKEALPIILKIADALGYMHEQNRFHLDVKPANIMLRKDGKVVLIDFGSSKQYAEVGGENTTTLAPCYTPGYAPSEQMNPKHTAFTAATDIYSLGATLYKMLTGLTPPSAIDLQNEDEELSPLPSEISSNVRTAVEKSMIPQRRKRTQTIKAFLANLEATTVEEDTHVDIEDEELTRREAEHTPHKDTYGNGDKVPFMVNGVKFNMTFVQGGTFVMGATSEQVSDASAYEMPVHKVKLHSFLIAQTVVTQELWEAIMPNNPSCFKGANLPVENVSWDDIQEFIRILNVFTGKQFRLPTEAEWEFAARGGINSKGYKYSGSNNPDDVAWYFKNSHSRYGFWGKCERQSHPVATKQSNELGLHDMSGNVWELCADNLGYYSFGEEINPIFSNDSSYKVIRGGNWRSDAGTCRVSNRAGCKPDHRDNLLGFRLALVP